MSRYYRLLSAFCLLMGMSLVPALARATTWSNGQVSYVSCVAGAAYCSVTLSSSPPTPPSCANNAPSMTIPLVNNQNAEQMLKVILAAKAAGWTVTLIGSDSCVTNSSQEDISMVQVH